MPVRPQANELVTVVEGRMRFTLLDDSFELEPGDVRRGHRERGARRVCSSTA